MDTRRAEARTSPVRNVAAVAAAVAASLVSLTVVSAAFLPSFDSAWPFVIGAFIAALFVGLMLSVDRRSRFVGVGFLMGSAVAIVIMSLLLLALPFVWLLFGYSD